MARRLMLALGFAAIASGAWAADRVRLVDGRTLSGEVTDSTRDGLTVRAIGKTEQVPVTSVRFVVFDEEPTQLTQARINLTNNGFETALELLEEAADAGDDRELVQQEIDFYTAVARTRLAIATRRNAREAGALLTAFTRDHPDSYHFYAVKEVTGDLLVALGRHDRAEPMYAELAKAPSASLRARAGLLVGKSLVAQDKHPDALERFDAVLALNSTDEGVREIQLEARLAKSRSLAATGELEAALEIARDVVRGAREEDVATLAAGYNAIGRCYEAAERPRDALFAYLHTDLLFNDDAATHAEALSRLSQLWREAGKPEAGRDALTRLRRRYASSPQAREAG